MCSYNYCLLLETKAIHYLCSCSLRASKKHLIDHIGTLQIISLQQRLETETECFVI